MTSWPPPPDSPDPPDSPVPVVMDAGPPPPGLPVPAPVAAEARAERLRAVWANELGGTTFEVGTGARRRFVKWAPAGSGIDLAAEAARMSWAVAFTPVHDALPVGHCPFSWSTDGRLREIGELAAAGVLDPSRWHPDHQGLSVEAAVELLAEPPPVDELVVCHGGLK